ncbi:MAG: hypothetical protein QXH13_02590 [Thermoplasmata archaeon]
MPGLLKQLQAMLGDTYAKGDLFENYVIDHFPQEFFKILHATTRRDDLGGRQIESAKNPDFHLQHIPSGHKFWVEAKFRRDLFQNKLVWCKEFQLKRYKEFQEEVRPEKVFIVIGLGGRPTSPETMYCIPLDEIEYVGLYLHKIEHYRRDPTAEFRYRNGVLF